MFKTAGAILKNLLYCRRMAIAVISIACLTLLGLRKEHDVSAAIAAVAMGLAAANAAEGTAKHRATFRKEREDVR